MTRRRKSTAQRGSYADDNLVGQQSIYEYMTRIDGGAIVTITESPEAKKGSPHTASAANNHAANAYERI